jgi:20S proteasome subunit alpha 7
VLLQYDLSVTTYSPDGKVFQTDYAQKAVDNSRWVKQWLLPSRYASGITSRCTCSLLQHGNGDQMQGRRSAGELGLQG